MSIFSEELVDLITEEDLTPKEEEIAAEILEELGVPEQIAEQVVEQDVAQAAPAPAAPAKLEEEVAPEMAPSETIVKVALF